MEHILEKFKMVESEFNNINECCNNNIKSLLNKDLYKTSFFYLYFLDKNINEFLQFGADKCKIDNFSNFCKELNINENEYIKENIDYYRYHFTSRDRKLTFTCSSKNFKSGYLHYFGITGEKNAILKSFEIFKNHCIGSDALCWGGRDFI